METTVVGAQGHKTYFVLPDTVIQEQVIGLLVHEDYEVYCVRDIQEARRLFILHPDSLAFLNIDDGMSESQWEDFIREVEADPDLASLRLGILSYRNDRLLAKKYLYDFRVRAGFIKLSPSVKESSKILLGVLEANEARGRRRYLRVRCPGNATVEWNSDGGPVQGRVSELSTVGMACHLEPDGKWPQRSVLRSLQLRLKGWRCRVDGVVLGSRQEEDKSNSYVVVFDGQTGDLEKERIRSYMRWALQENLEAELKSGPKLWSSN